MVNQTNTRVYHGNISSLELARALKAEFHRGNFVVQTFGKPKKIVLQITTDRNLQSGGQTALSVNLTDIEDGVMINIDKQKWLGVAASMGVSAISLAINPLNLLSRIDDIAQDIESLTMIDDVWGVIETKVKLAGASFDLSEKFNRVTCEYCGTAILPGEPNCIACGAPAGDIQPIACKFCGFVCSSDDDHCPNCSRPL